MIGFSARQPGALNPRASKAGIYVLNAAQNHRYARKVQQRPATRCEEIMFETALKPPS